jgi:hypothetical protein
MVRKGSSVRVRLRASVAFFVWSEALVSARLTLIAVCVVLLAGCSADASARGGSSFSTALDNGTIKVGIDLNAGGSISYLSQSGSSYNLVNHHDKGRYVQQSYYAGQYLDRRSEGQALRWSPWNWNPIQGGDAYGNPPTVLGWSNDGRTIYVKTRPLLWDMQRESCQCDFETWITVEGRRVRVRNQLTTFRTDTRWDVRTLWQELPAAYAIGDLNRVFSYVGTRPFSYGPLTEVPNTPSFPEHWHGTENWSACVNAQGFGFGVFSPPVTFFAGGLYGTPDGGEWDNSTCSLSPLGPAALDKTSAYSYRYFLTVGTIDQIRQSVYGLNSSLSTRSTSEQTWRFNVDGDFEGWAPSANVAGAFVASGSLKGAAQDTHPFLQGPAVGKSASLLNKVVVRLRNRTESTRARLLFQTQASGGWSSSKSKWVTIQPSSDFASYTFDMSTVPEWTGTVTRLGLVPVGGAGGFAIDSIKIAPAG